MNDPYLDLRDARGFKSAPNPEVISEQSNLTYPYCWIQMDNKNFCFVMEISIMQFTVLTFLFAYQIWFVWKLSYGYQFKGEPRLWIMTGCIGFCVRKCFDLKLLTLP